jgi:hypothetical protein
MRFLTLFLVLAVALSAQATSYYVAKDGTGDYTTIQAAIDGASSGDSIIIRGDQGTYTENLTLAQQLVLLGQGNGCGNVAATRIDGSLTMNPASSNSILAGLYFYSTTSQVGVNITSGVTGVLFRRCLIYWYYNYGSGVAVVQVGSSASVQLEECGILLSGNYAFTGVKIIGSGSTATLLNCLFAVLTGANHSAVLVPASSSAVLTNCVFISYNTVLTGTGGNWIIDHNIFWNTSWNGTMNVASVVASYNAITSSMTSFPGTDNITITSSPFVNWVTPIVWCDEDVHLTPESGLIDAGNPDAPNDRDGSRRDIGAYGGPLSYEPTGAPDFPFVTMFRASHNVPQNGVLEIRATGRVGRGQ